MRITNKSSFLELIKNHFLNDVTMKDLRYIKIFSEKKNKHFRVYIDRDVKEYDLSCVYYYNGSIRLYIDEYLYDEYDGTKLFKQGVMSFNNEGIIMYDSYHYNQPYISKQ